MAAIAHNNGFIAFMNEHRNDAWGIVIAQILDVLQRSEQSVLTFGVETEIAETYSPYGYPQFARNGNYLLKFTFAHDVTATARILPNKFVHPAYAFSIGTIDMECPIQDIASLEIRP